MIVRPVGNWFSSSIPPISITGPRDCRGRCFRIEDDFTHAGACGRCFGTNHPKLTSILNVICCAIEGHRRPHPACRPPSPGKRGEGNSRSVVLVPLPAFGRRLGSGTFAKVKRPQIIDDRTDLLPCDVEAVAGVDRYSRRGRASRCRAPAARGSSQISRRSFPGAS